MRGAARRRVFCAGLMATGATARAVKMSPDCTAAVSHGMRGPQCSQKFPTAVIGKLVWLRKLAGVDGFGRPLNAMALSPGAISTPNDARDWSAMTTPLFALPTMAKPLPAAMALSPAASKIPTPAPLPHTKSSRRSATDRLRTEMPRRELLTLRLPRVSRRDGHGEPATAPFAARPLAVLVPRLARTMLRRAVRETLRRACLPAS